MKFFRCAVDVMDEKNELAKHQISAWVVKGENEETARVRIEGHFRENHLLGKHKRIVSIEFVEIQLGVNEDIEEHLERRGGSELNVLF